MSVGFSKIRTDCPVATLAFSLLRKCCTVPSLETGAILKYLRYPTEGIYQKKKKDLHKM